MESINFTFKDENTNIEEIPAVQTAQNEPVAFENTKPGMRMQDKAGSDLYMPDFLSTQIGKYIKVQFPVGNNLTDRTGQLIKVGANYILLKASDGNIIMCDMFSIMFTEIIDNSAVIF